MNVKNITRLLEMLREIQSDDKRRENFNLNSWANTKDTACGTTCCAMGYAALDPYFRKKGLGMQFTLNSDNVKAIPIKSAKDFNKVLNKFNNITLNDGDYDVYLDKNGNTYMGFGAAEKLFDIKIDTSFIIFSPESYRKNNSGINRVINRVEYLLKYGEEKLDNKYHNVNRDY
jgi:hypothetical protein